MFTLKVQFDKKDSKQKGVIQTIFSWLQLKTQNLYFTFLHCDATKQDNCRSEVP